jgi:hypothetical protein
MDAYIRWQRWLKKIINRGRTGNNPAIHPALRRLPRHLSSLWEPGMAASILNTPGCA